MGRGQVVRQPVLTLLFGGSNPSAPVTGQKPLMVKAFLAQR